jgi:hypothetical protein
VIRQSHFIAVVGAFLIGCAVLLLVGGSAGVRSQARKEEQGHTEATASEEARCSQTRTFRGKGHLEYLQGVATTNDVPGCPNGGLLSGTEKADKLDGLKGDDEIHGLGGVDDILGGGGNDVTYGGPGDDVSLGGEDGDDVIYGGDGNDSVSGDDGEDVIYGGDGNDNVEGRDVGLKDTQRDELYCGKGKDGYDAGKLDYVDSSCEKKVMLRVGL